MNGFGPSKEQKTPKRNAYNAKFTYPSYKMVLPPFDF